MFAKKLCAKKEITLYETFFGHIRGQRKYVCKKVTREKEVTRQIRFTFLVRICAHSDNMCEEYGTYMVREEEYDRAQVHVSRCLYLVRGFRA